VTVLLDKHSLLWFLQADDRLSADAKAAIENSSNRKLVSIASCWEIAIKAGLGKLKLTEPAATFLATELPKNSFELLSISLSHATAVETLPPHHRDPFDCLLIVQALADGLPVLSHDVQFDAYGISRIW